MKQFEIGKTYKMTSPCDHECVWTFKVVKRTAQTVTILNEWNETYKLRINKEVSQYRNAETVFPLGRYSMCPVLTA